MRTGVSIFTVLLLCIAATNNAVAAKSGAIRTPLPVINIAKPGKCVEATDEMRRNHMNKILHQRDDTVHKGIRTKKHSLSNCINCHADEKTNSVLGKEGFCQSCHTYSAVSIDCFSCHNSKREAKSTINKTGVTQ